MHVDVSETYARLLTGACASRSLQFRWPTRILNHTENYSEGLIHAVLPMSFGNDRWYGAKRGWIIRLGMGIFMHFRAVFKVSESSSDIVGSRIGILKALPRKGD